MDSPSQQSPLRRLPWSDLLLAGLMLAGLMTAGVLTLGINTLALLAAGLLFLGLALLLVTGLTMSQSRFGPADRVTLMRAVLVLFLASLTVQPELLQRLIWPYTLLCLAALIMDGLDGHVARRTGTASPFGARFDMELDAFFILMLCVVLMVLDKAEAWVLLIGLMRYGFVISGWFWRWLNEPLPESFRRKTVCVWQLVTLMVALMPLTPPIFTHAILFIALLLLAASFAIDIRLLHQRYRSTGGLKCKS